MAADYSILNPTFWSAITAGFGAIGGILVGRMQLGSKRQEMKQTSAFQTHELLLRERTQIAEELDETRTALAVSQQRAGTAEEKHTECEIRGLERQREYGELWIRSRQLEAAIGLEPDEEIPEHIACFRGAKNG